MGEFIAWIIGWDLIVEYAIGNIAVAISWSDYFTGLMKGYGIDIPLHFTMDFLTAKRGYAAVTEAVAGGATVDALTAACAARRRRRQLRPDGWLSRRGSMRRTSARIPIVCRSAGTC